MLAFHGDVFGDHVAVGYELGVVLGDLGLGCDRVSGHDIRLDLLEGEGDGAVSGDCFTGHYFSSSLHALISFIISMASRGQTWAQMPQPLQCSRSMSTILSFSTLMEESGQAKKQIMQSLHFSRSLSGRSEPVSYTHLT